MRCFISPEPPFCWFLNDVLQNNGQTNYIGNCCDVEGYQGRNLPNNTLFFVVIIIPNNRNVCLEQYFSINFEIMEKSIKCFKQMGLIQTAKILILNNFIYQKPLILHLFICIEISAF